MSRRGLIERLRVRPAPAVVVVVGVLVLLLCSVQAVLGALTVGASNDEPTHKERLDVWFETGIYVPAYFLDPETETLRPHYEPGRAFAYGPAFSVVAHLFSVVIGVERFAEPSFDADAYASWHVVVAGLGIASALAVGLATLVMTRSRVIAVWAAAAVMAMPLWTGYSMWATKDVPVAAGWTFLTTALVLALAPSTARWGPIVIGVLTVAGVWFTVGVRPAMWLPLALVFIVAGVLSLIGRRQGRLRHGLALLLGASVACGMIAILFVRHPPSLSTLLLGTVRASGDFPWDGSTLTAGTLLSQNPPWWYLPAWVGGSTPVLLLGLFVAGSVIAVVALFRRSRTVSPPVLGFRTGAAAAVLWGMQALMLPLGAIMLGSTMYAGLRQHAYMLPAMMALAALGAHALWKTKRHRALAAALLTAAIVLPTVEQTILFPYQSTYKNVLAGPVNDRWESDMYWLSVPEALGRVPADADLGCYYNALRDEAETVLDPDIAIDCGIRFVAPFLPLQGSATDVEDDGHWWVIARKYRGSPIPPGCEDAGSITRWLHGEDVLMSYVLVCDPDLYGSDEE